MTKFLQVLEKIHHNSTRRLMTNDAFSLLVGQRQRRGLKRQRAQSQDKFTLIDREGKQSNKERAMLYIYGHKKIKKHIFEKIRNCTFSQITFTFSSVQVHYLYVCRHVPLTMHTFISYPRHDWHVVFLKAITCGYQGHWQGSSGNKWQINYASLGLNKQCNETV